MDDMEEPIEASPEFFSCAAKAPVTLPNARVSENYANLLACSSRFGYAVAASNVTLSVMKLADIQEAKSQTTDLDLSELGAQNVLSIQFIMGDTILLVHAESEGAEIFLLQFPALVSGNVQMLTKPVAAITYGAFSESSPVTTPSSQLVATLTSAVHVYNISATSCDPTVKIDIPGPLSLAFSPSDALLAVGTQRGCVYIHFTSDASLAATIIEVESGWIPFAIHFVREDAVLVTYSKDDNIRYIMWTLEVYGRAVSVASHFPFGELCLPSPDVSSDKHPNVVFNTITSWDMCVISSSISTEAEIVAKVENEWQVWKLDESKSVYLPINEDGEDTFPLGSALDFTDVNPIEPEDPSSEMIQPMPRFLVFTSEFKILPYSLTDARPGAKCDLIRLPSVLPQATKLERPVERIMFPDFSRPNERSSGTVAQSIRPSQGTHEIHGSKDNNHLSVTATASSRTSDTTGSSQVSVSLKTFTSATDGNKSGKDASEKETEWTRSTKTTKASYSSNPLESLPHSIRKPSVPKIPSDVASKEAEVLPETVPLHASSTGDGVNRSTTHSSLMTVPASQAFSGAGKFLSQFYNGKAEEGPQFHRCFTAEINHVEHDVITESAFPAQPEELTRREPESVSLQPSLDQAFIIASSGEGIDLIQSILCEMSEELATNRKAGAVLTSELKSQSHPILKRLDATRSALGDMLESTMARFQRESVLRTEVSETLKHILRVSRAYETLALETQVEDATGLSRSLKPEDIAMDEQTSTKEAEVVKSLASIEGRLAEEAAPKKYRNSSDVVREIYSSLSLQGIRIRRVLELLKSLSQRLEEHDQGGRQSSLGLSLARLEQLSLEDSKSPSTLKTERDQCSTVGTMQDSTNLKGIPVHSSTIPDESHELFPPNIDTLLRKLAMSGGRELICPLGQKLTVDSRSAQKKDAMSSREVHQETISSPYDETGASQMAEVRNLLEAANHSPRPSTTGAFSKSSVLRTTTAPSDRDVESLHGTLPPKMKTRDKEGAIQIFPKLSGSLSSFDVTQKNSAQLRTGASDEVLPKVLANNVFRGKESKTGLERRDASSVPPSFDVSSSPHRESDSNAFQVAESPEKTRSRPDLSSSLFTVGQFHGREPASKAPSASPTQATHDILPDDVGISDKGGFDGAEQSIISSTMPVVPKGSSSDSHFSTSTANKKGIPFASLPPDDFDSNEESLGTRNRTANQAPRPPFASLPPDDFGSTEQSSKNTKVQFASLPPDEDEVPTKQNREKSSLENKNLEVKEEQSIRSKAVEGTKSETARRTLIEDSSHRESAPAVVESSPFESVLKPASDTVKPDFPTSHTSHSVEQPKLDSDSSFFGTMTSNSAGTLGSSPFGYIPNQEEDKGNNVFGMTGLLATTAETFMSSSVQTPQSVSNQTETSIFGAVMQMNRPNEGSRNGDGGSPIAATESEDSDDENLRQGMDTTMGASNSNGSHGVSSQSATGGSLFGQAFSTAFGTPTSSSQLFGQSSSQTGSVGRQQMNATTGNFGTPDTNQMGEGSGLNNSPFGTIPPFGVASRVGGAPVFGAPSAIGRPSAFGNASLIGAQGSPFAMPSPRFGESSFGNQSSQSSSMLGFGVSSAGTGSASPFGTLATGTGFGESAGSASGFAALAGNSNGLVFGSGGGPPAFTSAAFTQRRA